MLVCTLTLWSGNILQYAHTCTLTMHPTSPALSTSSMRPPNATKLAVYEWNEKVLRLQHQLGSTCVSAPLSSPLLLSSPSSPSPSLPHYLTPTLRAHPQHLLGSAAAVLGGNNPTMPTRDGEVQGQVLVCVSCASVLCQRLGVDYLVHLSLLIREIAVKVTHYSSITWSHDLT